MSQFNTSIWERNQRSTEPPDEQLLDEVVVLIHTERYRQFSKFGNQHHLTPPQWGVVLGEEVGEVMRAICEGDEANLEDELIQVMAVCSAIIESIRYHRGDT